MAYLTDGWAADRGGAEPLLFRLVTTLDRRRWQPVVCTLFGDGRGGYAEQARAAGVPVRHFPLRLGRGPAAARDFIRLVRFLRRARFDVAHGWMDRGLGVIAATLAGVPARTQTIHLLSPEDGRLDRTVERITVNYLATATIAISAAMATELRERYGDAPGRIHVIPNGIAEARLDGGTPISRADLGLTPDAPVVLFVGRLVRQKGVDVLIDAMARVLAVRPEATLIVVGDGPERAVLTARTRARGIAGRVHFAGFQEHPGPWLRLADVVAMPSRWEGQGMSAVEAMAAARPVVAARVGGLPEVIVHGQTGLLPEPSVARVRVETLDPAPIAAALLRLLSDPNLARRMGAAGRRRFEEMFTHDRYLGAHVSLYGELTQRSRPS